MKITHARLGIVVLLGTLIAGCARQDARAQGAKVGEGPSNKDLTNAVRIALWTQDTLKPYYARLVWNVCELRKHLKQPLTPPCTELYSTAGPPDTLHMPPSGGN